MNFGRLLREPLLHFLGLGAALFAVYALVSPGNSGSGRIVVSAAGIADLAGQHQKLWGRAPTQAELDGLIQSRVDEEIMYREGVAMGLDRDDALIKRRVLQKYELVTDADDEVPAPTETELSDWMNRHAAMFRQPPVISFTQVLVPAAETPAAMQAGAAKLKVALEKGADPLVAGRATLLPTHIEPRALDAIARELGGAIAGAVETGPVGKWVGPVASPFGIHLLRVDTRANGVLPPLATVRPQVLREWQNAERVKAHSARIRDLRNGYDVVIERTTAP